MNEEHVKSLIEQIEFAHQRGIKDEHSEAKLAELKAMIEEPESYVDLVNECTSKSALETLVKEHKGVDIDKRKSLASLKELALTL